MVIEKHLYSDEVYSDDEMLFRGYERVYYWNLEGCVIVYALSNTDTSEPLHFSLFSNNMITSKLGYLCLVRQTSLSPYSSTYGNAVRYYYKTYPTQ